MALLAVSLWMSTAAPANAIPDRVGAQAHDELGRRLISQGEYQGAIAQLRKATALDPTWPDALYDLATALAMDERPGEAVAAYRTFLERFPHDKRAGQVREAIQSFDDSKREGASERSPSRSRPRK